MRVNVCSRSLAAFVFLAIVAVSHAVVWWVPVWKQTTVLRYHPKKGWYPVKHGGHGSTFLKPKKLPPLSHLVKKATQHYKKVVDSHGPLSHDVHNHHPKYRGWRRKKPIHKEVHHIHHHPPPPPHPPCPSCHSSWNPSKTKDHEPPKSKPKPHRPPPLPTKLKQKRRPRPRPNIVPSFKLNLPGPFRLRQIPPSDFLPKPGGPPRSRPRGKKIYRQNPFHKVVHFTPGDAKKKPFSRGKGNKHYFKSVRRPIKQLRSPPIPHPPHRLKSPKGNTFFSGFNSNDDFGLRLKPNKSPNVPRVKEFLDHENVGPFNFHNFPKTNNPPKPPVVNTFYSSFGNGDIFKVDNLPKDPKFHDFLAKPEPGFSFDTFPKMNNPPPAPKFPNTYFSNNQFGNIFHNGPSKKPYQSPRVPRIRSMFPLLHRPNFKVNKYPKVYDHPRPRPKPLKPYKRHYFPRNHNRPRPHHDFPRIHDSPKPNDDFPHINDHDHDHDHPPKLHDDDDHSKEHDHDHNHDNHHHDSDEDAPKSNHLQNSGGHHHFGGYGGTGGFGTSSGFSTGQRGQGWGEWVW